MNYYNEWDKNAAAWLRNLIAAGLIPAGDVDERSVSLVTGSDLKGYTQCHFFAGIGGWPLALKLAGWPENRQVWTGSCPCQPFSVAGKRKGKDDDRHVWPDFLRLIAECLPECCVGEQVASKDGKVWLAGIRSDLEDVGYRVGAADLCAAGTGEESEGRFVYPDQTARIERVIVGAPHIRQRLYWVADANWEGRGLVSSGNDEGRGDASRNDVDGCSEVGGLADAADGDGRRGERGTEEGTRQGGLGRRRSPSGSPSRRLGDAVEPGLEGHAGHGDDGNQPGRICAEQGGPVAAPGAACGVDHTTPFRRQSNQANGCKHDSGDQQAGEGSESCDRRIYGWGAFDLLSCLDGKTRRIEPGTFPLAHGIPGRVGKLRAYGNAIVPALAAEFIKAYLEC